MDRDLLPPDADSTGSAPTPVEWSVPWSGLDGLFVFLLFVGAVVLLWSVASAFEFDSPFLILEAMLFGALTIAWVRFRHRGSVRRLLGEGWAGVRWGSLWRGVGLGVAAFALQLVWFGILEAIVGLPEEGGPPIGPSIVQAGLLAVIVSDALLTPISEELFFRGLIFQGVRQRRGTRRAVWISSIVFGIGHLDLTLTGSLVSIPAAIFFGWLMARSFEKRGTLLVPMVAHVTNNLLVVLIVATAPAGGTSV